MQATVAAYRPSAAQMRVSARRWQPGGSGAGLRRPLAVLSGRRQLGGVARAAQPEPSSAPHDAEVVTLKEVASALAQLSSSIKTGFQALDDKQAEQGRLLAKQGRKLDEQNRMLAAHGRLLGGMAENVVRLRRHAQGDDVPLRRSVEIDALDGMLPICSLAGLPANMGSLLHGVAYSSTAFNCLFMVVEKMMQDEAAERGIVLPACPGDTLAAKAGWLRQARQTLRQLRRKKRGKAAWEPACNGLVAYAEAAGFPADSSRQLAFLSKEKHRGLALMLLAADATGKLFERVEMDGAPILHVTSEGLQLDLLEIKAQPTVIDEAVQQLQAQANILVLALALSNAAALQESGPLQVVATVEVAAGRPDQQAVKFWESQQLLVGGKGPAPQVPMQLRIRH